MIAADCFWKNDFKTVIVILWWSDMPVPIVQLYLNCLTLLVKIKSIELGLSRFLKQVGSFIKLARL